MLDFDLEQLLENVRVEAGGGGAETGEGKAPLPVVGPGGLGRVGRERMTVSAGTGARAP